MSFGLMSPSLMSVSLVLTMLFRPEGMIPSSRRAAEFHEGVREDYLYDVEAQ